VSEGDGHADGALDDPDADDDADGGADDEVVLGAAEVGVVLDTGGATGCEVRGCVVDG
jgi:hypothetical protein